MGPDEPNAPGPSAAGMRDHLVMLAIYARLRVSSLLRPQAKTARQDVQGEVDGEWPVDNPDAPDTPTPSPLRPPTGVHWRLFALTGPSLIVIGVGLRVLGHEGTDAALIVIGSCVLFSHGYMRYFALDMVHYEGFDIGSS